MAETFDKEQDLFDYFLYLERRIELV